MNRRKFLSTAGCTIFASVAGCIETGEETTKLGERIDERSANFTVQDFTVQQSIAYRGSVHSRVRNDADHQYMIFGVDIHSDVNNRKIYDRFTMSINGKIREEIGVPRISTENQAELKRDMYLIYDVPRDLSLTDEHLKFSGLNRDYKWSLPDAVESEGLSTYVQNPPNPQIESFDVPDSISADEDSAEVEVTVSEDSSGIVDVKEPVKLLLGSTKTSGSSAYTATVKDGETNVHDFRVPIYPNQGPDVETIRLSWGQGSMSRDIPIQK
jgi:hypothetical protein